jgi:hypothetical protein
MTRIGNCWLRSADEWDHHFGCGTYYQCRLLYVTSERFLQVDVPCISRTIHSGVLGGSGPGTQRGQICIAVRNSASVGSRMLPGAPRHGGFLGGENRRVAPP